MSVLLVGFDSAWTARNSGALVGATLDCDGRMRAIGPPLVANFAQAEEAISGWQEKHYPVRTLILIDQPTIVRNERSQRPVENIVSSAISLRYGGMQPAYTGRQGMFDREAPIWRFLGRFAGAADLNAPRARSLVIETYPALTILARDWTLPDDQRPNTGRLPKYNPVRPTFRKEHWVDLCRRLKGYFDHRWGLEAISQWIASAGQIAPCKPDQDCLDACLCLLVAIELAEGRECLVVGNQDSGYIVVPANERLEDELAARCERTKRDRQLWLRRFGLG